MKPCTSKDLTNKRTELQRNVHVKGFMKLKFMHLINYLGATDYLPVMKICFLNHTVTYFLSKIRQVLTTITFFNSLIFTS